MCGKINSEEASHNAKCHSDKDEASFLSRQKNCCDRWNDNVGEDWNNAARAHDEHDCKTDGNVKQEIPEIEDTDLLPLAAFKRAATDWFHRRGKSHLARHLRCREAEREEREYVGCVYSLWEKYPGCCSEKQD